ncbi:hypothetical protein PPS11_09385 [Pseudomonas putida S11]|nr:hypothetical protein PPS11_09385 [Pseudomonas putida S11]
MIHLQQQRQIVARVGIESRAFQVLLLLVQPFQQPRDLPFAVGQHPVGLAGINPVHRLQFDRQVFVHPQPRRNRPDQVRTRRRNDQDAIPALAVLGNAAAGRRRR